VESGPLPLERPIRFGADCELDPNSYELRRSGRVLKLERIPTEILLFLVERRGQLVTRDEIAERVWGKDVFLDTDNSINGAIRKIRQVLKDDPERPRFIQTISGRGYRFIAPAPEEAQPAATPDPDTASLAPTQAVSVPALAADDGKLLPPRAMKSRKAHWLVVAAIAGVVLGGAATAAWIFRPWSSPRVHPAGGRVILAVLPFQNLTGDPSQDYFSDGMTEEMIAEIATLDPEHLGVIARTSVMSYQHNPKPVTQIGRELGAQYVLEGSVRRDGNKVRVTAQLIRVEDQTHLWAREYDRERKDLLVLQSDIARATANEIASALGEQAPGVPGAAPFATPQQYESHELYLQGLYFWNQRKIVPAIDYFQQAIDKDPQNARAYAGLADSYTLRGGYSGVESPEYAARAESAALRALQLDASLAEAHTAFALIRENYHWDWQTAEQEYRKAIALNPSYSTAHQWYAECLMWQGRFDEALKESDRARQLDPLSLIIATDRGAIFYYWRQYDRAIQEFLRVREMDPNFPRSGLIALAYAHNGSFDKAFAEQGPALDAPWSWTDRAELYGLAGRRADAQNALNGLLQLQQRQPPHQSVNMACVAVAYLSVGNNQQALAWLQRAYKEQPNTLTSLKVDPVYDPVRSDPRFQDLLQRVGLEVNAGGPLKVP
jgi:TolB-like protein/DNA-binding winged helix-turn-helix (wHTH) protein/Tfp pilus assembly protein PilF